MSQPFSQGGTLLTFNDLITAINANATVSVLASLNSNGQLVIQDPQLRGNLQVAATLLGAAATFPPATATLTEDDFAGNDNNPEANTGLLALVDVDEISLLCCPDEYYFGPGNTAIAGMLVDQCETLMDRFAILEASSATVQPENNNPSVNSEYAAYYYPWLTIINADTGVQMLVPPCGHILKQPALRGRPVAGDETVCVLPASSLACSADQDSGIEIVGETAGRR